MRSSIQVIAAMAMMNALVGACSESTAPVAQPVVSWFAFELSASGARVASFTGETSVTTMRNGFSEPEFGPGSALVSQDYTPFYLAQPDLDFREPNSYLAFGLIGPLDVGTFTVRDPVLGSDGQSFTGTYSVRLASGAWEHYAITGGTITLFRIGNRLSGTLDLQSSRVQRVNMGFVAAPESTSLALTGRLAALRR